jgi:hypothetical protein
MEMKLKVKVVIETTLDVSSSSCPVESTPTYMLNLEQKNFHELLSQIIYDDDTKFDNTLTLLDKNNLPIAEKYWKEGPI